MTGNIIVAFGDADLILPSDSLAVAWSKAYIEIHVGSNNVFPSTATRRNARVVRF
jgi:hypothetical protein